MGKKPKDKAEMDSTKDTKERQKAMEAVAKHLRFSVGVKAAVVKRRKIEYFSGLKAVDCLMSSKWTKKPTDLDSPVPYFASRSSAIDFCTLLLRQRFIIRLRKVEIISKEDPAALTAGGKDKDDDNTLRKRKEKVTDSPRPKKQTDVSDSNDGKKKKRKFRLEVHDQQTFTDSVEEFYYWEYDPPSRGTYFIGFGIVVGAIALTLQPLWPDSTRAGIWYCSMSLFGLMGCMVLLIIARWFVFGLVQMFTIGKLHFWVFPNLDNEKCGFFDSFKPVYSAEWKKEKTRKKKEREADSKEVDQDQDGGQENTLPANGGEDNDEEVQSGDLLNNSSENTDIDQLEVQV